MPTHQPNNSQKNNDNSNTGVLRTVRSFKRATLIIAVLVAATILTVTAYMQERGPVVPQTAKPQLPTATDTKPAPAKIGSADANSEDVNREKQPIGAQLIPDLNLPTTFGTCQTAGPIEVESSTGTASGTQTAYSTLALAFTGINGGTLHTGTVTVDVCGNTTETGTAALNQVAGVTSVTMSPAGGVARTISGAIAAASPLINLNGADNVTIDGLNTGGNSLTLSNTTVGTTAGSSTIRFIADATNNTITRTTVLGSAAPTTLANIAGTILFSTGTTTGNDNNTISNCDIGPAGANLPSKVIMGSGTSSAIENDNVLITGNNIFDWFNAANPDTAINVVTGNEGWTISNNKFYQTAARTVTASGTRHSAITLNNSTGAFSVSGNTIGFASSAGTGTYTISGTSNEFRGIDAPSVNTSVATSIQNNTISGINQTSSRASTTLGNAAFIAIAIGETGGLFNVGTTTGNNVGSLDASSSIVVAESSTTANTAPVIGIYDFSFANSNLSNNKFGTITISNGGSGTTVGFRGILINGTSGQSVTVNNNTIGGTAPGSITDSIVGSYGMYGIQNTATTTSANLSATGNLVRNLSGNSTGAGLIISSGLLFSPTSAGANAISQNTIHSLSNASGAAANSIYGMSLSLPAAANVIERNFIHSLSLTSTVTGTQIWGINGGTTGTTTYKNNMIRLGVDAAGNSVTQPSSIIGIRDATGATNQYYHNSIYVGGTGVLATPTASNSYCFFSDVITVTRNFQDNIFWNARSNAVGGGTAHFAIRVGGTAPNPAGLTSNYNDLHFSGTDGATGVFNNVVVPTLAAWRTATGQDANSFIGDPQFIAPNGSAATVDLHIHATNATPIEKNGLAIGTVTDDYDGVARAGLTPTDVGADAGNFVSSVIQFNSATYTVAENVGGGLATITLSRTQTVGAVSVTASTVAGGSATPVDDYTTTSTPVSFIDGSATASFTIPITNDSIYEVDETVNLALSSPANSAILGTPNTAVLTITDDDPNDITFNADGNLAAGTYNNITINSPAVVTVTGNVVVNGCLNLNSGATLNMGAFTFTGTGCFTANSGSTLGIGSAAGITTGATGNVQVGGTRTFSSGANYVYNGALNQAVGNALPGTVANLTIANTGGAGNNTVTGNSGQAVTGTLTVQSGVYSSASDYVDVVIAPAGTLSLAANITVSGNWTNNGTFTSNGFGVTFDGIANQSISGSSSTSFSALTISNTGGAGSNIVSLAQNISDTSLSVTSGAFDQGAGSTVSSGAASVSSGASWTNSGTGDLTLSGGVSNAGTINFNGAGSGCPQTDEILIRSSVGGAQRAWSGLGTFSLTDVDVQDQAGTAVISVRSGTNNGNNGLNWLFVAQCNAYTWSGTVSTDWTNPLNWSPSRTAAPTDILYFGAGTPAPIVTNVAGATGGNTETIAELHIASGVTPSFSSGGANTLLINAGSGNTGLDVSNLAVTGANALTMRLASGTLGSVTGTMSFGDGGHRLIGQAAGAISFGGLSIFSTQSGFTGNAFGDGSNAANGAPDSVRFKCDLSLNCSLYIQNAGGSPFGASGNPSVVTFETGATARFLTASGFDANGRSYSNLQISDGSVAVNASDTGSGNFHFDNLEVNSTGSADSSLTYTGTGAAAISIGGAGIYSTGVGSGSSLSNINLTAPGGFTLSRAGTMTIGAIDTARAINLDGNVTVTNGTTVDLQRIMLLGLANPNSKTVTVDYTGALNGSSTGYVVGSVSKQFGGGSSITSQSFPVGSTTGYSPIDVTNAIGTGSLTISATGSALSGFSGANKLSRYWSIASSGVTQADLKFNYVVGDVVGAEANYKIFRKNGSNVFTQFNPTTLDTGNHFATLTGVTDFSDWTLAEPSALQPGTIQFDSATYSVNEGAGMVTLNVTRTGGTDGAVSFGYFTTDGTASSVAGADFLSQTGGSSFAAGSATNQTITITIVDDAIYEGNEDFTVTLNNPSGGATIGSPSVATVTITDNDTPSCTPPSVVYVDDNWVGTTPGTDPDAGGPATNFGCDSFATIQGGVNGVTAGGIVNVRAGTYAEAILINKALTLRGAKFGQDPNTRFAAFVTGANGPKADPTLESIITAAATAPASGANDTLHVMSSNVIIDGFVVDGNNPALAQGGATVIGGINTDSRRAIQTEDAAGNPFAASTVTVQYNVVQNYAQRGVELINGTASNTAPATTGNVITQNLVRNFGLDGIVLAFNAHADITFNTVVTNDYPTEAGIWVQDFLNVGPSYTINISNNTVTVGQDNFGGIWTNLAYLPDLNINNNTVNAAASVVSGSDFTYGIYVTSLRPGSDASLTGNIVGSSGGQFDRGIALWNLGTGLTTTVTGGTVGKSVKSVSLHDNDPNFGLAGSNSAVNLSGVSIDGTGVAADIGIFVDATGSTGDTVAMEISGNTSIINTSTAISVVGANASANIHDNVASIHDNTTAVSVSGGAATITHNTIYANATGLSFSSGATATAHYNRIISTTTGIENPNNLTLNLENNWWGCNAGPGNAGCGAVTGTGADFDPWIVLGVSASPTLVTPGGSSLVTADMTKNSAGATPAGTVPDMPIAWSATNGTMFPTSGTITSGLATSTFTSTSNSSGSACGMVDNQNTCANITVTQPSFSINDVTLAEGSPSGTTMFVFTVTRTGASAVATSVNFSTVNGTATLADNDYQSNSGTLNFAASDTSMPVTVLVNKDTTVEPDEAFTVHLDTAVNATISDADGTGTITNDDVCGPQSIVYVDDNWVGTTPGTDPDAGGPATNFGCDSFATIQGGINGVATGGTVMVYAGSYIENPSISRAMTLKGAQFGVDARNRAATESLVRTNGNALAVFSVTAANVTIDGFSIDGDDPGLAGPALLASGDDTNVQYGVRPTGAGGNLNVSNNIIKKAFIGLRGDVAAQGNVVNQNSFDSIGNFDFGYCVSIRNNFYANVTNNKMTRAWTGIHINNHSGAGGPASFTISGNEIHAYAGGILYWLQFNGATGATITNNQMTAEAGAVANNFGMLMVSIQNAVNPTFTSNTVSGHQYGIGLFNVPTTSTITLGSTNSVSGSTLAGIFLTDNLNFNPVGTTNFLAGGPGAASTVNVTGMSVSGTAGSGLKVEGQTNAQSLVATGSTITGIGTGVELQGPSANVTAHFNRILGTTNAITNANNVTSNLENNWWGCNAGPGNAGCGAVTGTGADFDPWIVLGVSASPGSVSPGGSSLVTADMTRNSAGATPAGTVPDMPVAWSATNGTMFPTSGTITSGLATSTFTSTNSSSGSACAMVDNQNTCTGVTVIVPSFAINDVTMNEGNAGPFSFTFTITKTGAGAASVDFNTVNGSATAPSDFTAITPTTVNFLSADTTKQVTVFVNGDTDFEGNETFTVHLSNAIGATISDADGTGTITNDDTCAAFATVYVDDSWVGTPIGSDPDAGGPATVFGCDSFATIQEGVTAVTAGGTVNVAAGTYTENVTIAKPLTLTGAGAASVLLRPATSNPNCGGAGGGSICAGGSNIILVQASNVTISGMTLDGDNPGLTSGEVFGGADIDARNGIITNHLMATYNNLEVHHTTVKNIYLRGMYASSGGSFNFHDNTVDNVQANPGSICMFNFLGAGAFTNNNVSACNDGIASNHSRGTTYTGNTVTTSASGIHSDNAGDSGGANDTISGNTVTNSQTFGYGIWVFVAYKTVHVDNNTVTNTDVGFAVFGDSGSTTSTKPSSAGDSHTPGRTAPKSANLSEAGPSLQRPAAPNAPPSPPYAAQFTGNTVDGQNKANSTGVYFTTSQIAFGSGNPKVAFTSNTVVNNVDGFYLEAETGFTLETAASFNRIVGNTNSQATQASGAGLAGTLNGSMENNWWGCNAGPNNAGCGTVVGSGIDFNPWIVLGVSASPNPIPPFGNSTVTADMRFNSAAADTSGAGTVPPMPVSFTATNGTMAPPTGTITAGQAMSTFTSTSSSSGSACAMVDNQNICTNINITLPQFSIGDVTMNEGNSGPTSFTFTITKTGAGAASVDYATVDGTATEPSDYTAIPTTTLNFLSSDTTRQVTVFVNGDVFIESNEVFTVHLSNPINATISDADGNGNITNDDVCGAFTTVYVDDDWVGTTPGADPDGIGPATQFGCDSFAKIQEGVDAVPVNGTVIVNSGTYDEDVTINKDGVKVLGAGPGTTNIRGPIGGPGSTVAIPANNVTLAGFTITRLGNTVADWNNPNLNSVGVSISSSFTNILIRDNILTGNRTGIDINNSSGHIIRNNVIDFNRTGMIFRNVTDNMTVVENFITNNWTVGVLFLDASVGSNVPLQTALNGIFSNNNISANWYGQIVDRQTGGSLPAPGANPKNFRGNWYGTTSPVVTTANSAEPGYAAQIPVAYGGTATPPGGQPDIAGPASANFIYKPFLQSGTDTNIETVPGRGTFGFQGVQNGDIIVRQTSLQGWIQQHSTCGAAGTGSQNFVVGPGTPPLGEGSLQFLIGSNGDSFETVRTADFSNKRIDALTKLGYHTYVTQDGSGGQAAYLLLSIDFNGDNTLDDQIFFEPVYQSAAFFPSNPQGPLVVGSWQQWDALNGGWWSLNNIAGAGPGTNVKSLTQYLAAQPNARILNTATGGFRIATGCGAGAWDNFDGNTDALSVGVTGANSRYDFEPLPRLTINDVTHSEGDAGTTDYTFTISLSRDSEQPITVDYSTADDSAVAPGDYNPVTTTTLTFNPGETMKMVTVQVNGDTTFEANDTFFVNLFNVNANATIQDGQGVGTINNDDGQPSFAIDDVTHMEGNGGTTAYTFTVTKTGSTGLPSSVMFTTQDGSATLADNDYQMNSGMLNFTATDTMQQITVLVNGDTTIEPDEAFNVHLSSAMNATISDADGAGTIQNDDSTTISGRVTYQSGSLGVRTVTMTLTGNNAFVTRTTMTDTNGDYTFTDVPLGNNYTLTPSKTGDVGNLHIESIDASNAARYVAGLDVPTAIQQIAGDADGDSVLTSFDASYIARYVAGLPDTAIVGTWKFQPPSTSYPNLSSNQLNQNFAAILVGDTDGNWMPTIAPPVGGDGNVRAIRPSSPQVTVNVSLPHVPGAVGSIISVPMTVGDVTGQVVRAYDAQVTFNAAIIKPCVANECGGGPTEKPFDKTGTLSQDMTVTANTNNTGHLILSAFQTDDMIGSGTLINLRFHVVGTPGQNSPLTFEDYTDPNPTFHPGFRFNSGNPQAAASSGSVTVNGPTASTSRLSGRITDANGEPVGGVTVTVTGGPRVMRSITNKDGYYTVAGLETNGFYTVTPLRANYVFAPANRSFSLIGDRTDAVFTGSSIGTDEGNPLESPEFFVRQQYLDFLNREPEQAGLDFWGGQLRACGNNEQCIVQRRLDVSAAFFISQEFGESGLYLYDLYQGALGRQPDYAEYAADRRLVVGGPRLEADKAAFAASFVERAEFTTQYPLTMSDEVYVDALLRQAEQKSGLDLSRERTRLLQLYQTGATVTESRSFVLRTVVEAEAFKQTQYNAGFVLSEYFSYLGRNPDRNGYAFWLNVLNNGDPNNYRGMVCSFVTSAEYQGRFATVIPRSNVECR